MRPLGYFVAASIVLALLQVAAKVAALVAIIAALTALISRPQETIGCLTCFMLLGLAGGFPLTSMLLLATLAIIGWKADSQSATSGQPTQNRHDAFD